MPPMASKASTNTSPDSSPPVSILLQELGLLPALPLRHLQCVAPLGSREAFVLDLSNMPTSCRVAPISRRAWSSAPRRVRSGLPPRAWGAQHPDSIQTGWDQAKRPCERMCRHSGSVPPVASLERAATRLGEPRSAGGGRVRRRGRRISPCFCVVSPSQLAASHPFGTNVLPQSSDRAASGF